MSIIAKSIPSFDHFRFLSKITIKKESDCWNWVGGLMSTGYGNIYIKNKGYLAHRVSYSLFKGEPDKGLVIDHICRNRQCVNPDHLRAVTMRENALENSVSISSKNHEKKTCKNGHSLSGDNLCNYPSEKYRRCRTCENNRSRAYSKGEKAKEKIRENGRQRSAKKRAERCL